MHAYFQTNHAKISLLNVTIESLFSVVCQGMIPRLCLSMAACINREGGLGSLLSASAAFHGFIIYIFDRGPRKCIYIVWLRHHTKFLYDVCRTNEVRVFTTILSFRPDCTRNIHDSHAQLKIISLNKA